MCNQNEWIVRQAFLAYDHGDVARMMDFVHPDLECTYLGPGEDNPQPQVFHGREELAKALRRQAGERTYDVVTVRDGLIVGLHACRDRGEARWFAGIG